MQNKYKVLGVVGEGAYGIVYKCRNEETKEFVAIKKFKETDDDIVKKTMKRELRVLQLLKHENIVEFKEAFRKKNNLFLVFEYVERNLLELLEEKPTGLEPNLIRNLIYQLCKAIKYLHDQNIIHRDVKPENLLISNSMKLKLCDFGFARKITQNKKENLTDYVATRWYRSPELLITSGVYGPEVDYWAIGCIMGELADGNPLFPGDNETDQLHCIQKVLGNLPDDQVELFYKNPLYNGMKLLDVQKPETLEKRYMGKLPKVAINFMKGLLELNPKKRLVGNKVFSHPYFASLENHNIRNTVGSSQSQRERSNYNSNMVTIPKINSEKSNHESANNSMIAAGKNISTTNINIINFNTYNTGNPNPNNSIGQIENNNPNSFRDSSPPSQGVPKPKPKQNKDKQISSMAMTMTNQFPSMYQKNFKKNQQMSFTSRKSYEYKKETEFPSSTSINFNNSNIKDLNFMTMFPQNPFIGAGYSTFYKNNKNDIYNYNINTHFSNLGTNKPKKSKKESKNCIIEEEDEESNKINPKKSRSLNAKPKQKVREASPPIKEKSSYNAYYYSNNRNQSNSPYRNGNKSNSKGKNKNFGAMPNISCYNFGHTKEKSNHGANNNVYLPSLNKNNNNLYHANFKKFHQMINK